MKKLLCNILVFAVVISVSSIAVSCGASQKAQYIEAIQPILQQSNVLDEDIHNIISSNTSLIMSNQREQISTIEAESRELMTSLTSLIPPNDYKDAQEALKNAFTAMSTICIEFKECIDHYSLVDEEGLGDHCTNGLYYVSMFVNTHSLTYKLNAQTEYTQAYTIAGENVEWLYYAIEDLNNCKDAITEYRTALNAAGKILDITITSNITVDEITCVQNGLKEEKQTNQTCITQTDQILDGLQKL